jgi:hypothetical protein
VLPISATPPPMAIIEAEAKKAVPWKQQSIGWRQDARLAADEGAHPSRR